MTSIGKMCVALTSVVASVAMNAVVSAAPITVSSYTYGTLQPASNFADSLDGGTELINGDLPASTAYSDTQWVGFLEPSGNSVPQPLVVFDLGASYDLSSVAVTYLHSSTQAGGNITAPEDMLVSVSDDNVTFSSPVSKVGSFDSSSGDAIREAVEDLTGMTGRYVKLDFRNTLPNNAGEKNGEWTFLAEVTFDGTMVPEPSSVILATLGLLGLALCGWHHRK